MGLLLSGLPTATVVLLLPRQVPKVNLLNDDTYRWDCVILRTNRAKCALNKEILDLLNEESISGACSGRAYARG